MAVLASWHDQFKSDPSMTIVARLYKECRVAEANTLETLNRMEIFDLTEIENKKKEKEAAKQAKKEKEKAKREEEKKKRRAQETQIRGAPFIFEKVSIDMVIDCLYAIPLLTVRYRVQEKPQVLNAVANASQATNNLVNAIKV